MSDAARPVLDRLSDAFFAVDTNWRFTYCNDAAAELLERSRGDLVGRVLWDEFSSRGASERSPPVGFFRAMQRQEPQTFDLYVDHRETWFEARAYPAPSGLSVYLRNVTERKRRETELAQHAAVVDAMHDGVVTLDGDNRIVSVNPAMERVLGVDREVLIGEHVDAVVSRAAIDDADAIEIGRAINDIDVGNASLRTVELLFTDTTGDRRIAEIRLVPVDDDTASIAAIVRDVSDEREHERIVTSLHEVTRWLLESTDPEEISAIAVHAGSDLLDLAISGIWLLDEEHGYLDPVAGTAGAHDEFGGLPRLHPGDGLAWDVFEDGEPALFDELEDVDGLFNPDTPIRSEVIAPIGTHGILMSGSLEPHQFDETDVDLIATLTENTRAALDRADRERVLRTRTERLERQTERLEAVATVLSEDLKSELEAVSTALDTDGSPPSRTADEWEFPLADEPVAETLDRAERLVDDVREFARNATSVGPRSRITLATAVSAAVDASDLDPNAISVETDARLRADPDRFRYMLESVLDDVAARTAVMESAVTVRVDVIGPAESETGGRGFYIVDDAPESPPAATDPGESVTRVTADAADGFGLAVARTIAEAHGWSVSISATGEAGTRFEIRDVTTLELP